MSVIVWDGKSIVADKQATVAGMRITTTKMRRFDDVVLAWSGNQDVGEAMAFWFERGCCKNDWPELQKDKDEWARLIVVSKERVVSYEREPIALIVEDPFMAWGSGRDYAMGAMAMGATARQAVEVAMRFDNLCGMGIDEYKL